MIEVEIWKSDNNKEERHHYAKDGTYLFGFSKDLLSVKLYKKILTLVKEELSLYDKN